ncbi:Aldehyde dehydrogenase family protein [Azotobacter beijerinckii]|uniref:Aldehyde dehydrogenase family protein n=1 Tax=Azotobacter beijerinckii TaxID=170623 RepID=A0A1H6YW47_9GAMM|nr:Aldehyde dehydrogenase family protein [Azotobacter beijerinckii]
MKEIKRFINGQYVGSASGKLFDNVNPANGQVIARVHEAGEAEVDAAVKATPADLVKNVPNEAFEMATPDGSSALNYGVRVIGVISPWNLPLLLMTWRVGPALVCGNTVMVKPSEETPSTTALLGEVMNTTGVYNVVHGFGGDSADAFVTAPPDVDTLTFTDDAEQALARGVEGRFAEMSFDFCLRPAATVEATQRSQRPLPLQTA